MKQEIILPKTIGKFYAFTFDNQVFEFIVKDNSKMYCEALSQDLGITRLIIKPNFEVYFENHQAISLRSFPYEGNKNNLIGHYMIPPELHQYLKANSLIQYTEEMANFYHLDKEEEPLLSNPLSKKPIKKVLVPKPKSNK